MFGLLEKPKQYTVKEIHEDFDQSGDRLLAEAKEIIEKAGVKQDYVSLAESLGFTQAKHVVAAKALIPTMELALQLEQLKAKYPNQKFLTVKQLKQLCAKYGLIAAPVAHYKEEVPEENLLEIANAQKLDRADAYVAPFMFRIEQYSEDATLANKLKFGNEWHVLDSQYIYSHVLDSTYDISHWRDDLRRALNKQMMDQGISNKVYQRLDFKREQSTTGLQIAAPKSHFDLTGLEKSKDGLAFSKVAKTQIVDEDKKPVKDPIVFEMLAGDYVRILTMWGDESKDQVFNQ